MRDKPHKKLDLWKKSIELVLMVYKVTKEFPREEEFGLSRSDPFGKFSSAQGCGFGAVQYFRRSYKGFKKGQGAFSQPEA